MDHVMSGRQTIGNVGSTWRGTVTCRCGWQAAVGLEESPAAVQQAISRAWMAHVAGPDASDGAAARSGMVPAGS
ncbi:MAG: hypothetical protein ACREOE_14615 [Gemmatimonadales bacterium]